MRGANEKPNIVREFRDGLAAFVGRRVRIYRRNHRVLEGYLDAVPEIGQSWRKPR